MSGRAAGDYPLLMSLFRASALVSLLALAACHGGNGGLPQHYEDKDAALARLEDPARDTWAKPDEVVAALPIDRPDFVIADIGSGSGYFTRRLAKRVPEGKVYAIDVDKDLKKYIEDHRDEWGTPNIETRLAMYENPLLPSGGIDMVFVSNTYAFIRDRDTYFTAVHHALKPGGYLAIIDFRKEAACDAVEDPPKVEQRTPRADVVSQLGGVGFALVDEKDFLPHQYFLVFKRD